MSDSSLLLPLVSLCCLRNLTSGAETGKTFGVHRQLRALCWPSLVSAAFGPWALVGLAGLSSSPREPSFTCPGHLLLSLLFCFVGVLHLTRPHIQHRQMSGQGNSRDLTWWCLVSGAHGSLSQSRLEIRSVESSNSSLQASRPLHCWKVRV